MFQFADSNNVDLFYMPQPSAAADYLAVKSTLCVRFG